MEHKDFKIGTVFQTCTGQRWRCTDVGKRTILAIELKPELDEAWFVGPPFAVPEVPFDEKELARAYRSKIDAIKDAVAKADCSAHPGFPHEQVSLMMRARTSGASRSYPNHRLLEIDRVGLDGEILHPFAAEQDGKSWNIRIYRTFEQTFDSMPEAEFIRLRASTEADVRRRKQAVAAAP
ncbi:hypothetical protein ACFQS6_17580 [Xanthomonas populi]|uniref:hypothetical protein n=1 Tax=Xanthomonas populi TaxID=53414 RepID=UPI001ABF9CFE|nr:hypothetical protein [Xanthomonas populi]